MTSGIALGIAVGICIAVGALEWLLTGDGFDGLRPKAERAVQRMQVEFRDPMRTSVRHTETAFTIFQNRNV